MEPSFVVFIVLAAAVVILLARTATVVPQQQAFIVENLGKYSRTLQAGFHILVPFMERIVYRHSLKEQALDVAEQICKLANVSSKAKATSITGDAIDVRQACVARDAEALAHREARHELVLERRALASGRRGGE